MNSVGAIAQTITVDTGFGSNVRIHDYSGHGGDIQTDGSGLATTRIPRNLNGLDYVCYSRGGICGGFSIQTHSLTQAFEGDQDFDIKPAAMDQPVQIARI